MACSICNEFRGKGSLQSRSTPDVAYSSPRSNRNHRSRIFTWAELQVSAISCYVCEILVEGCRGCFVQHSIVEEEILHGSLRFYYPSDIEEAEEADSDKTLTFILTDGTRFEVEIFTSEDKDGHIPDAWDYFPVSSRTSPHTRSPEALTKLRTWITECIESHGGSDGLCEEAEELQYLPTRVVDVGSDVNSVKLIEPKGTRDKYLCLSHCWGLVQIITTTKSTLQEHKRCIQWDDLSRTFQDAISLTRILGFRYIWIDSLCIIQDDTGDWMVEAAKMAAVYSNGYLTIAATHSANGDGGLYTATSDFPVSGTTPNQEKYGLCFRKRIDHHLEYVQTLNYNNPDGTSDVLPGDPTVVRFPLLTRAWVYQERMLSTRVVHFGHYEMFFECKSNIVCECDGIRYHGSGKASPISLVKIEYADVLDDYKGGASDDIDKIDIMYHGARLWRTIVASYTALLLTNAKDRLLAIGGLAMQLASVRKSRYLAGLWEETLLDDLLWIVHTTSRHRKPRRYPRDVPTWSWASVETQASYWDEIIFSDVDGADYTERSDFEHFCKVEKCEVQSARGNVFGSDLHGSLEITGLVVEVKLERETQMQDGFERIDHYISSSGTRLPIKPDYLLDFDNVGKTEPDSPVFCLRMSRLQEGRMETLVALVLRKSPDMVNCYERIGTLQRSGVVGSIDPRGGIFDQAATMSVTIV